MIVFWVERGDGHGQVVRENILAVKRERTRHWDRHWLLGGKVLAM